MRFGGGRGEWGMGGACFGRGADAGAGCYSRVVLVLDARCCCCFCSFAASAGLLLLALLSFANGIAGEAGSGSFGMLEILERKGVRSGTGNGIPQRLT